MAAAKRNRAVNFLPREEYLLMELVSKYKSFVECKNTDSITNKQKEKAWHELTEEFNATSGLYPRSTANLKSKFDNIKRGTKKLLQYEKFERGVGATGDGIIKPPSPEEEPKFSKIKCVRIEGLTNPYFNSSIHDYAAGEGEYIDLAILHPDQFMLTNKAVDDPEPITLSGPHLQDSGEPSNSSSAEQDWPTKVSNGLNKPCSCSSDSYKSTPDVTSNGPTVTETRLSADQEVAAKIEKKAARKSKEYRMNVKFMKQDLERHRQRAKQEQELHELKVLSLKLDIALKRKRLKLRKMTRTAPQEFEVEEEPN